MAEAEEEVEVEVEEVEVVVVVREQRDPQRALVLPDGEGWQGRRATMMCLRPARGDPDQRESHRGAGHGLRQAGKE